MAQVGTCWKVGQLEAGMGVLNTEKWKKVFANDNVRIGKFQLWKHTPRYS
jgi:hypothetical protein